MPHAGAEVEVCAAVQQVLRDAHAELGQLDGQVEVDLGVGDHVEDVADPVDRLLARLHDLLGHHDDLRQEVAELPVVGPRVLAVLLEELHGLGQRVDGYVAKRRPQPEPVVRVTMREVQPVDRLAQAVGVRTEAPGVRCEELPVDQHKRVLAFDDVCRVRDVVVQERGDEGVDADVAGALRHRDDGIGQWYRHGWTSEMRWGARTATGRPRQDAPAGWSSQSRRRRRRCRPGSAHPRRAARSACATSAWSWRTGGPR